MFKNGITEEGKLKLLSVINSAKQTKKINEQMKTKQKEEKPQENKAIYAKKGDDKYNETMDINKDEVVTYEEYIRYCHKKNQNKKQQKTK